MTPTQVLAGEVLAVQVLASTIGAGSIANAEDVVRAATTVLIRGS